MPLDGLRMSSSACAREFSQLKQSSFDSTASQGDKPVEAQNSSAPAADRSVRLRRNVSSADGQSHMLKRRRLSAGLVRKAIRFFRRNTVQ